MSRRRETKPDLPSDTKTVRVVCTDRGRHREKYFGKLHVRRAPETQSGWTVNLPHDDDDCLCLPYVAVKCSLCGRDLPLKPETVLNLFLWLAALERPVFDISTFHDL